jgi:hypothetical protein
MKTIMGMRMRVIVLTALFALIPALTFAAGGLPTKIVSCDGTGVNGGRECTVCDIATTAGNILNTMIFIAVFLAAIMFAWAGWGYLSAAGDTGAIGKSRTTFMNVLIGLLIILSAWLLIDTLMRTLVGSQLGPWNKIC